MDESPVQSAVCVIGHPIAGNPAQFCISRILKSLEIDWQCLSFDVPSESLAAAIAGIDVLHFAGALIAAPHHTAVPVASSSTDPLAPPWCDGLARDASGAWIGCNFLGHTLIQLIQSHEQRIGRSLVTCIFLGDRQSFQAMTLPFVNILPPQQYCLGLTGLESLTSEPAPTLASDPSDNAESPAAKPPEQASEQADTPAESNLLHCPLLLIRPQVAAAQPKKSSVKAPVNQDLIDSLLEELHAQSLVLNLAPAGVPWPVLRGDDEIPHITRITSLDLEIGRIAAAIHRWTGHTADRDALAEAIEEYLEI